MANSKKSLLESPKFPLKKVNEASAREKSGGGRPPHWEMVFWWTRKPLVSARAIIAAALLPEDVDVKRFIYALRLDKNVPHRYNPELSWLGEYANYIKGKSLLDPFAGFGSIPLEALRLGLSPVVAVELLPTAYIFLKAVLEYPAKYGEQLVKDVEKWGNWIIEQLKNDPQIKELYDEDVAVYIGTWEIKCPHCGKWTPLIGNWWLARVKKGDKYSRLAWMDYEKEGDQIKIKVIDLNKQLNKKLIDAKIDTKTGKVKIKSIQGKWIEYNVRKPNIQARNETATCLHCGNTIRYIDPQTGKHYTQKPKGTKLEWYVKHAIKQYNQGNKTLARQRILVKVKVKDKDLIFEPATQQDQQKLQKAQQYIQELIEKRDPDTPTEAIAPYENRSIWVIVYGFDKFYKLFNPRQLLTLVKLVKLIRKVGHKIEQEKIAEGYTKEEAHKYAEATTTYLAITFVRYVAFNSVTATIRADTIMGSIVAGSLTFRGIAMVWNYGEILPYANITGSWIRNLRSTINGLRYLGSSVPNSANIGVEIKLSDANKLDKTNVIKYSLIITDPPYFDDVPYAELSDFYFVWLKRALSDIRDGRLYPRFLVEAFFSRVGGGWREIRTQWEEFADKEISLNANRPAFGGDKEKAKKFFIEGLKRSFVNMSRLLVDDGVLVTYYAHTDPEAWEALLEAGWRGGKLRVTNALPLTTESAQRVTARGKLALDVSIIVVWRKGVGGRAFADEVYRDAIREGSSWALTLWKNDYRGTSFFYGVMGRVLEIFTRFEDIVGSGGSVSVHKLVQEYVYPATVESVVLGLSKIAGVKGVSGRVSSSVGMFYVISKILFPLSKSGRHVLNRSSVSILSIGTRADVSVLKRWNILEKKDSNFYLMEPYTDDLNKFLMERGIDPADPKLRCSVDALHLLEFWAKSLPARAFEERLEALRSKYPSFVEEALVIAEIFAKLLDSSDPEHALCERILMLIRGGVLV